MWLCAAAVAAQVRHDDPITPRRDPRGMAVTQPIDRSRGEVAMDEHQRAARAQLAISEARPVAAREIIDRQIRGTHRDHSYISKILHALQKALTQCARRASLRPDGMSR